MKMRPPAAMAAAIGAALVAWAGLTHVLSDVPLLRESLLAPSPQESLPARSAASPAPSALAAPPPSKRPAVRPQIAPPARPPNVLFIMADDHAAHALSCYGSRINRTPQIDRLAAGGMRFENCFVTNSICAPSRAVILTGKYSHLNGVIDNGQAFDGSQQTLPKLLQKAGYETALIGKWHLQSDPTGFDYWHILPGQGSYYNPDFIEMGRRHRIRGYVTDIIGNETIRWLRERDPDKPFLLMSHHKAPHRAWMPKSKYAREYLRRRIPLPPTFDDDYATRCDAAREQAMTIEDHLTPRDLKREPPEGMEGAALKEWKYQRYMRDYLACIDSIDENVGRILDFLDESGLAENTVVVYTSDQGFFLGDHGWYDKRFMYEQSLRMPLLVRYPPEVPPGSVASAMALNLDFAPTLLDLAGVGIPDDMQGRSLRPILRGEPPGDWRTAMYYSYYEYQPGGHLVRPHYGIRTERYKLIRFRDGAGPAEGGRATGDRAGPAEGGRATGGPAADGRAAGECWELYDLAVDPHELNNLYGDPAYADQIRSLKSALAHLQKQYGEPPDLIRRLTEESLKRFGMPGMAGRGEPTEASPP